MKSTQTMYEKHHKTARGEEFSLFKKERGSFFRHYIGKSKDVLDIGCRDGALTETFLKGNKVLGLDIDTNALGKAKKKGIQTKKVDLNGDWGINKSFDAVVAAEVLEHLYYPEQVVEKVAKVLNKDGVFVGSVPNAYNVKNRVRYLFANKKGTPLQDPTHINHFSHKELYNLLKKYFRTVRIVGLVDKKFRFLAKKSPNLFSYGLMWVCKGKR